MARPARTTLQSLLDAAQSVVDKHGAPNEAAWTEQDVTDRTAKLIHRSTTIWTRPAPPQR